MAYVCMNPGTAWLRMTRLAILNFLVSHGLPGIVYCSPPASNDVGLHELYENIFQYSWWLLGNAHTLVHFLPDTRDAASGVVGLREVYEDEEDLHLIMELCQGGDWFEHLIKHGR
jgi:hypothetical protein